MTNEDVTLENGMRALLEPQESPSVAIGFFVNRGSRHDPVNVAGAMHFMEHMCFRSSRRRSTQELTEAVDELGAQWNGSTWWEGACFHLWLPAENLSAGLTLLSQTMRPALKQDEFEIEREVILEEIAMYEDAPEDLVLDHLMSAAYAGSGLANPVLGTHDSLNHMTRAGMLDFCNQRLRADNMVFVAIGGMDTCKVIQQLRRLCGRWRRGTNAETTRKPRFRAGRHVRTVPILHRTHLMFGVRAPSRGHRLSPEATVLASVLGDVENSRLYWAIQQKGLADEIYADYEGFSDTGILYVYAATSDGNAGKVRDLIRKEMADLPRSLRAEDLERTKAKLKTDLMCERENHVDHLEAIASRLGSGLKPLSLDDEIRVLDAVTLESVQTYVRRFPNERLVEVDVRSPE